MNNIIEIKLPNDQFLRDNNSIRNYFIVRSKTLFSNSNLNFLTNLEGFISIEISNEQTDKLCIILIRCQIWETPSFIDNLKALRLN